MTCGRLFLFLLVLIVPVHAQDSSTAQKPGSLEKLSSPVSRDLSLNGCDPQDFPISHDTAREVFEVHVPKRNVNWRLGLDASDYDQPFLTRFQSDARNKVQTPEFTVNLMHGEAQLLFTVILPKFEECKAIYLQARATNKAPESLTKDLATFDSRKYIRRKYSFQAFGTDIALLIDPVETTNLDTKFYGRYKTDDAVLRALQRDIRMEKIAAHLETDEACAIQFLLRHLRELMANRRQNQDDAAIKSRREADAAKKAAEEEKAKAAALLDKMK